MAEGADFPKFWNGLPPERQRQQRARVLEHPGRPSGNAFDQECVARGRQRAAPLKPAGRRIPASATFGQDPVVQIDNRQVFPIAPHVVVIPLFHPARRKSHGLQNSGEAARAAAVHAKDCQNQGSLRILRAATKPAY
jgi:hypothetical protein